MEFRKITTFVCFLGLLCLSKGQGQQQQQQQQQQQMAQQQQQLAQQRQMAQQQMAAQQMAAQQQWAQQQMAQQQQQLLAQQQQQMSSPTVRLQFFNQVDPSLPTPAPGQTVKIHYNGTFLNGTLFDSSRNPNREPLSFVVDANQIIPGLNAAVKMMRPGQRGYITIPSMYAYGPTGNGNVIPPNTDLIFDVLLLEIVNTQQTNQGVAMNPNPQPANTAMAG